MFIGYIFQRFSCDERKKKEALTVLVKKFGLGTKTMYV